MKKNQIFTLCLLTSFAYNCQADDLFKSIKGIIKAEQEFFENLSKELDDLNSEEQDKKIEFVTVDNDEKTVTIKIALPKELNNKEALEKLDIKSSKKKLEGNLEHQESSIYFAVTNNRVLTVSKVIKKTNDNEKNKHSSLSSSSQTVTLPSIVNTLDAVAEIKDGILSIVLPKSVQPQDWKQVPIKTN